MKKQYYISISLAVGIIIGFLVTILCYYPQIMGGGVIGSVAKLSDIPFINNDFEGLQVDGDIAYVYRHSYRDLHYMITGKTTVEALKKFCKPGNGWRFDSVPQASPFSWEHDFFKTTRSNFPISDSNGPAFWAYKEHSKSIKNNEIYDIKIYYQKEDQRFTASVHANGHRFK
jgi:hypothetical protein